MSKYAITVGVEENIEDIDRDEVLKEISEFLDEEPETEHPPRHLSEPTTDALLTVGTILLSNPEQLTQLYQTLKNLPQFTIENVGMRIENTFVFEAPEEVNIDVDVNILSKHESTVLYQSEEKPEFVKQRERERFIENINNSRSHRDLSSFSGRA